MLTCVSFLSLCCDVQYDNLLCRMISVYGGLGPVPGARNAWSYWIDHILKQRERFGFVAAAMITTRGVVSAFSKDFLPTTAEVQVK